MQNGVTDPRNVLLVTQRLNNANYPVHNRATSAYVTVRTLRARLVAAGLLIDTSGHLRARCQMAPRARAARALSYVYTPSARR